MSSTFSSYQIARTGMDVSQRGLFVTGHNISNVNTPGYVRQQVIITESKPVQAGKHIIGIGPNVQETRQIRNEFLDNMYRNENNQLGYWEALSKTIDEIQTIMGEPYGQGLNKDIDQFFKSWSELSKNPGGLTERAIVRQRAISLLNTINHVGLQIDKIQKDLNKEIDLKIHEINTIAGEIAELNLKIVENEGKGNKANDLRDQRNLLLDRLSKYVSVDITEKPNGTTLITIGGMYLVNHNQTNTIISDYNAQDSVFYTAKWERDNKEIQLTGGLLKGLIDVRGDVASYKGSVENGSLIEGADINSDILTPGYQFTPGELNLIPELKKGLNIMVNTMARLVNDIHRTGVGLDGSSGLDFFVKIDTNLPFEMGNIALNTEFDDDNGLNKIAASISTMPDDNTNAQRILEIRDKEIFTTANITTDIEGLYNAIIIWWGALGQEAMRAEDSQYQLTLQLQNQKETISGVSMDEELTFMMKYQHAYNASARTINVIDEMIDTIINRMGLVGR